MSVIAIVIAFIIIFSSSFFCGSLVLVSWQVFISSLVMKLDFISQSSSKSTIPFERLRRIQQCQVIFHSIFASMLWSKWMVHEKWPPQWGVWNHDLSVMSLLPYAFPLHQRQRQICFRSWFCYSPQYWILFYSHNSYLLP